MKAIDGYVEVTRDEFREFLGKYGKPLEHDCNAIGEPPSHSYYDFNAPSKHAVGTADRAAEARRAYCVYDEGMGQGPPHFYVRRSGSGGTAQSKEVAS